MAQMPIEVIEVGDVSPDSLRQAISLANSLQSEFVYLSMLEAEAKGLHVYAYNKADLADLLHTVERFKFRISGYHPFLIAFVDTQIGSGRFTNLFGGSRPTKGLAVVTIANVPNVIISSTRMAAYYLYFLAVYTFSFIAPDHRPHDDTRGCVFDFMENKTDLLKSMKARALCDECRRTLVSGQISISPQHLEALDRMFAECGRLIKKGRDNQEDARDLSRVFIGSSTEGLKVANTLRKLLKEEVAAEVWNQGTVFGLGTATLEALEQAVLKYDFGIFVFTPDDQIHTRGELKPVARDNVIFELGLFIGKLTRHRAFIVHPSKKAIELPSDLLGITTAVYNPNNVDLTAALKLACKQIRNAIQQANASTAENWGERVRHAY
jgi:predicted nucleotide-binding protein